MEDEEKKIDENQPPATDESPLIPEDENETKSIQKQFSSEFNIIDPTIFSKKKQSIDILRNSTPIPISNKELSDLSSHEDDEPSVSSVNSSSCHLDDIEIPNSIKRLMNKMLKAVCRKIYLHDIDYLEASYNSDWEMNYFKKTDNLYDINKFKNKFYLDDDEDEETFTDVSHSKTDEFTSNLKQSGNEAVSLLKPSKIDISPDDTLNDTDYKNLNVILKDEQRANRVVRFKGLPLPVINHRPQYHHEERQQRVLNNRLHDDYFFTESSRRLKPINKNDTYHDKEKSDVEDTNNQNLYKKNQQKKKQVNSALNKKHEARINMMKSAFGVDLNSTTRSKSLLSKRMKDNPNKPVIKSNLKYHEVEQYTTLPAIRKTKSALPERTQFKDYLSLKNDLKNKQDTGPIDERQKYPRPISSKQPWGTIVHPPYGLGFQKMTPYELKQSVDRLYYVPKPPPLPPKTVTSLSKPDFYDMLNRLTYGSSAKAADRCRTQAASCYRDIGILNSYAWNGNFYHRKLFL